MSSTLFWTPINEGRRVFADDVKYILRKKFGGAIDATLNENDLGYIRGLNDAGVGGSSEVLEALVKFGSIRIWEVY
jgi:hypothetical protein